MAGPHSNQQSPYSGPYGQTSVGAEQSPYGQYPQSPYQATGQFPAAGGASPNTGPWTPNGGMPGAETKPAKKRNVLGIIALIVAVIGAIFACIPGALILGWVLLPLGFILGLVGLFISGARKRSAIAAIIVSILGTILGVMVFVTVVDDAFSDAFESDVAVSNSAEGGADGAEAGVAQESAEAATGTRENPAGIGDTLTSSDWEVVVHGVNRNATAEVMAENPYNSPPPAGSQYALVDISATYVGDDAGQLAFIDGAWVTESGNVIRDFDHSAVIPNPLEGEVYNGGTVRGNIALAVPESDRGLLRVGLGLIDEAFVNVG